MHEHWLGYLKIFWLCLILVGCYKVSCLNLQIYVKNLCSYLTYQSRYFSSNSRHSYYKNQTKSSIPELGRGEGDKVNFRSPGLL